MRKSICAVVVSVCVAALWSAAPAGAAPVPHSPPHVPPSPGGFTPVAPVRVLDPHVLTPQGRVIVHVAGQGGVPPNAGAVLLSISVIAPGAAGSVVAHPNGSAVPALAHVSFTAGANAQGLVAVPLGGGAVDLNNRSSGLVNVAADVVGYFRFGGKVTAGEFVPVPPGQVLGGAGGTPAQVAAGGAATVRVAGVAGVPRDAAAVLVNLTATGAGSLAAYRHGAVRPLRADALAMPGVAASTQAVVQVGEDGSIDLFNDSTGTARALAHVVGYYRGGTPVATGALASRQPDMALDTRDGSGTAQAGPVPPHGTLTFSTGSNAEWSVPAAAAGVFVVTVHEPAAPGTLTVTPHGDPASVLPNLSFPAGRTTSGLVVVRAGAEDSLDLRNDSGAPVEVTVAMAGLYTDGQLGAVTGRVTDSAGHPVEGVSVGARSGSSSQTVDAVATGPDGTYAIGGLRAAGDYEVCFTADRARGSSSANGDLDQCFDGQDDSGGIIGATPVQVRAGAVTDRIDGHLHQAGAITGRVTDEAGHPLAGVHVTASSNTPTRETSTGIDGRYRINRLTTSRPQVCFDEFGGVVTGGTSTTGYVRTCEFLDVEAGQTAVQDEQLSAGAAVAGRVTDAAGNPIRGARIAVVTAGSSVSFFGVEPVTDAAGRYRVVGLAASTYRVCVSPAEATGGRSTTGYLTQCFGGGQLPSGPESGQPAPGTDIPLVPGQLHDGADIPLPDAGAIGGVVTGPDGQPRSGIDVRVRIGGFLYGDVESAADGRYQVNGLRAGTYTVCFFPPGFAFPPPSGLLDQCYNAVKPVLSSPNVTVVEGHLTGNTDAALNGGGQVSGRVTDSGGHPVANVLVREVNGLFGQDVRTAADGTYTLSYVFPGGAQVCVDARDATGGSSTAGYLDECYDNVAPDGTPTSVPVTAGHTTAGIDVALDAAGAITGTATDPDGNPLTGVEVSVLRQGDPFGVGNLSGPDGSVTFTRLLPGTYRVCFQTPFFGTVTGGTSGGGYADVCHATTVAVVSGTDAHVTEPLPELSAVAGRALDTAGAPLPGVGIHVTDSTGRELRSDTGIFTAADGSYVFDRIPPGTVTVCFTGNGTSGRQCWDHVDSGAPTPVTLAPGQRRTGIDALLQPEFPH